MKKSIALIHEGLAEIMISGKGISREVAVALGSLSPDDLFVLLPLTDSLRRHFCGTAISRCAIANAKSGKCPENCAFCAQSVHYQTAVESFPLLTVDLLLQQASQARKQGAAHFSIVTSGSAVTGRDEMARVREMIVGIAGLGMAPCASLGFLDEAAAHTYKEAGLRHYHHNLETARSYFPNICTTHTYDRAVETVAAAKGAGLYVCSGGIIGMGESWEQRVELALTLRDLEVDSIPLNFLHPVPGTPLGNQPGVGAFAGLLTIAMFRLVCPTRDIRVCGGRARTFPDAQAMLFAAGANGVMVGNYLTTAGRQWADDDRLLSEWGNGGDG
ncbi:MAG: biotin synthase BioB [Deltaproteobacteria bacterium]|nr:biotin synthase BioB [Candidatus Anaeroferrophillus wilburensis]MBN2888087.1 biotin synthase BioB [Deltaproteobacteria bacterium]